MTTWHEEDWTVNVWAPLAGYLLKEIFWLIFGKKETKSRIVKAFSAPKEEKKRWIG